MENQHPSLPVLAQGAAHFASFAVISWLDGLSRRDKEIQRRRPHIVKSCNALERALAIDALGMGPP